VFFFFFFFMVEKDLGFIESIQKMP